MAMPMSSAFTTADRRKKIVTYGKSARLTAPQKFLDDAPSPERPRKHAASSHASLEKPVTTQGAGRALSNIRANRYKSPTASDIFDVPSDDEPTPRPSAAPTKKHSPPKHKALDPFDIPSSADEEPATSRKTGKGAQPPREVEAAQPLVYASKKRVQEHGQIQAPSSDDPLAAPPPPVRRRAKTPQAAQPPVSAGASQTAKRVAPKPRARSRATTPAPPSSAAQKRPKPTATTVSKDLPAVGSNATKSPDLDVFDVPSSDEDASARTPVRPRPAPLPRAKVSAVSRAPPSPAPSVESDASNASHKRKRRASASSSIRAHVVEPPERRREASVPQRSRKYQKKEDSISPGHKAKSPQPTLPIANKSEQPSINKPKRTRVRTNTNPPRNPIVKGQSTPAKLHNMLAVRSLAKPSPMLEVPKPPVAEDETMYEIRDLATPQAKPAKRPISGSVTPRQQALFNNLLDDSSDSTTPMPSISRLQLTDRKPASSISALARSSSDIPQSAHTRKGRLLDMLKQAAPSSDEDSESDEETEEDITEIPSVSVPAMDIAQKSQAPQDILDEMDVDSGPTVNSQTSQATVQLHSGAKVTYAKQRSYLEESNLEDGLLLSMDLDDELDLNPKNQGTISEDEDETAQVRGIHELRRQGQHHKFIAEAQATIDDLSGKGGLNSSQRRSAMIDFATRMADKSYMDQLLESALTSSLLKSIAPTGEVIFDFAATVAVLHILQAKPGFVVLDQTYQSKVLVTLSKLLELDMDINRIAKDRKTNMAPRARETVSEFRTLILHSSVWPAEKPEKLSPRLVAMKVLELLVIGLRKSGNMEPIVDEIMVNKLLDTTSGPSQRLKAAKATAQDHLVLDMACSILESLSVSKDGQATWSNEILGRLMDMMTVVFGAASVSPISLVIRLCMNLTNNKPKACQLFAIPEFVLAITRFISHSFELLAAVVDETRRIEVMEDLILSLGAMINLAEFSDKARTSVIADSDELVDQLVKIFLEGSERADQADSMEESQTSVTIGYLTVLLGNLCLNDKLRMKVRSRLPGQKLDMLVQKVKEFVLYNQKVDKLTGQFEGEEGMETLKNFTMRLMLVVEKLEKANA